MVWIIFIILFVLKLTGVATMSWWIVFLPLYIIPLIAVVVFISILLLAVLMALVNAIIGK